MREWNKMAKYENENTDDKNNRNKKDDKINRFIFAQYYTEKDTI